MNVYQRLSNIAEIEFSDIVDIGENLKDTNAIKAFLTFARGIVNK